MTSFDETEHPRDTDGTFATKTHSTPETGFAATYQPCGPAHLALIRARTAQPVDDAAVRAASLDAMREYVSDLVPTATTAAVLLWDPSTDPDEREFDMLFDNAYAGGPEDGAEPVELTDDVRDRLSHLVSDAGTSFRRFDDVERRDGFSEGDTGGQYAEWHIDLAARPKTTASTAAHVAELTQQIEALEQRRQEALVDALRLRALDLAPTAVSLSLRADTFTDELVPTTLVDAEGRVILDFGTVGLSGPAHEAHLDFLRFTEMIDVDTTPLDTPKHPWTYEVDLTV